MAFPPFARDFTDVAGNLLSGPITLRFTREDTGKPVQVYQDFSGTVPLGSMPTFADTRVICFLAEAGHFHVHVTANGYSRELEYQPVGLAQASNLTFSDPAGDWSDEAVYQFGSYVTHEGSTFLSRIEDNEGNEPDATTPGSTAEWMYIPTIAGPSGVGDKFDSVVFVQGKPRPAELVLRQVFAATPITFPSGLGASVASSEVAADAEAVFALAKNGAPFGTVTFAAASQTGIVTSASAVTFNSLDILTITAPATRDATLADISITLTGNR